MKRHPKVCRNFSQYKTCRHDENCAYKHVEEVNFTQQTEVNELVAQIISKHENDISVLLKDIDKIKLIVSNMGSQIKSLEKELQQTKNDTEPYIEDETITPNAVNSTENLKEREDQWIYCELCAYKCKAGKTMRKHMNTKHET